MTRRCLASTARAGDILLTHDAAGDVLDTAHLETRQLELKGKRQPVGVFVVK